MKMNYYYAISCLIILKDRHSLILNKKNEKVLNYLSTIELIDEFESNQIPDTAKIAEATGLPKNKINPILYQSYHEIIATLKHRPLPLNEYIHAIYIRRHEIDEFGSKKDSKVEIERDQDRTFWGEFKLPVTPRIGEHLSLDFLERNINYTYGIVTEVHHEIHGTKQRIVIYVHPRRNYYWQWERIKRENEDEERWLRDLRNLA